MRRMLWLIVFAMLLVSAAPGMAQTPLQFNDRTDPISLIGSYYNAISRADYATAYSFWETPPENATLDQFAAGFANTLSVQAFVQLPIVTDAGAGNLFASLPTLVIAVDNSSGQQTFAGCFTAHKTNVPVGNATEPDPNWFLRDATLQPQGALDFAVLDNVCEQSTTLAGTGIAPVQSDPPTLIASYFGGIAQGNPNGVAGFWEDPSKNILNTIFARYFTDAPDIDVYIDPQIIGEGAAGSVFARVRALVRVTTGGETHLLPACFTTRKSNVPVGNATEPDPNWSFYDATIFEAANAPSAAALLPLICVD